MLFDQNPRIASSGRRAVVTAVDVQLRVPRPRDFVHLNSDLLVMFQRVGFFNLAALHAFLIGTIKL